MICGTMHRQPDLRSFPIAPKRPYMIEQHGQTRVDDYFWMRRREDPAVMEYLKAENSFAAVAMEHTRALQEELYLEMKSRIQEEDITASERIGDFFYYRRTQTGYQYPIFCRRHHSPGSTEETLLDQNTLAEGKTFCRIGALAVSPDQQKLAYSVDTDGSEKCTLFIKDLTNGKLYPETISNTSGDVYTHSGVAWAQDNDTIFYVTLDEVLRPCRVFRHSLGTNPDQDVLVYHESDESFFLFVLKTRSQRYIETLSRSTLTTEWRVLPAHEPLGDFKVFEPRRHGIEYQIEHLGDRFYILTNEDAQNFRLMQTPVDASSRDNWLEVVGHRSDVLIEAMAAFANHIVLFERKEGLKQIRIAASDGIHDVRYVPFPESVYDFHPSQNPEFNTDSVRFTYSSPVTPNSVIDFNMKTEEWILQKQDAIPSGHDPSAYSMERIRAIAPDGTAIPISLVYKKGLVRNGRNPTLLYGYGAYGVSSDPGFNSNRLSLIDRGFVFAIAHIRGGSDLGRAWYDSGKMLQKRNTFTDFIACAESLIEQGYTCREELAITGGSAGGLLVCACMTMRPDLCNTVIARVPFVDVVNSMSDPTIPLTTLEYDEWGNPDDETYFKYMLSYSPYDNIRAARYPHVLLTTGLNDPRVAYWEPAKFTAKLRELKIDDNLLLLKTNMAAGHAGASGRYDFLRELAFDYAFLLDRLGYGKSRSKSFSS
jgi:oligopeptidase B